MSGTQRFALGGFPVVIAARCHWATDLIALALLLAGVGEAICNSEALLESEGSAGFMIPIPIGAFVAGESPLCPGWGGTLT